MEKSNVSLEKDLILILISGLPYKFHLDQRRLTELLECSGCSSS